MELARNGPQPAEFMETYFKNLTAEDGTKEKFVQDLMVLIHDAEDLIKETGDSVAEKSKEKLISALEKVKATCRRVEAKASTGTHSTAQLIGDHPFSAVGLAVGCGLILGLLINRK